MASANSNGLSAVLAGLMSPNDGVRTEAERVYNDAVQRSCEEVRGSGAAERDSARSARGVVVAGGQRARQARGAAELERKLRGLLRGLLRGMPALCGDG